MGFRDIRLGQKAYGWFFIAVGILIIITHFFDYKVAAENLVTRSEHDVTGCKGVKRRQDITRESEMFPGLCTPLSNGYGLRPFFKKGPILVSIFCEAVEFGVPEVPVRHNGVPVIEILVSFIIVRIGCPGTRI